MDTQRAVVSGHPGGGGGGGYSTEKPIETAVAVNPYSKGKTSEDVGQPEIRAGDTRVSHRNLKGEYGTPCYHQ